MSVQSARARSDERARSLPGDELLPSPIDSITHAVTIRRPPREVWPWLAQMGAGRAGWYSYDFVDNGGQHSSERVIPELQDVRVGGIMPWLPGATEGFSVLSVEPERSLVLGAVSPDGRLLSTWAFVLEEAAPGVTRLLVRARAGEGYSPPFHLPRWTVKTLVRLGHGIMQRKQLLGIARRVEAYA
jgi:hypothetical protein